MINYVKLNDELLYKVYECYNNNVEELYKKLNYEEFCNNLYNHIEFDKDGVFVAVSSEKVVGFICSHVRQVEAYNDSKPGYVSTFIVDKRYRNQGVGKKLLSLAEEYIKSLGKNKICFGYMCTLNWPWYIPNTDLHDHNGAPGVLVNSEIYLFLLNNGYDVVNEQDAFHLDLDKFNVPKRVLDDLEKCNKEGIYITLYDCEKHFGLEEFYEDVNDEAFERVIRYNLNLENPMPFAVIVKDDKIMGWTGAFYTEKSGRAHFDGIVISPKVRGKGLGRALFATLAEYSKTHGSKFMTFFTGRNNFARYIYLSLGFKIIMSFAVMEKEV